MDSDPEAITEIPSSASASSWHTAELPEPSCCESCWTFLRSLIGSPFYKTEISILSLVHLICTLAIGISLSITVEIEEAKHITKSSLYGFLVVYMWISILWIIGAFCCGNTSGCCLAQRQHDGHIPGYLIIGVTFLCIGSSFITVVELLPFAFSKACNISQINMTKTASDNMETELKFEAIYSITKFVFLILQLYFFCRFSSKTFLDTCSMKMFLMHIIAVNLCTWFYIIVDESVDHTPKRPRYAAFTNSCLPFKSIDGIRQAIDGFLYPFSIEYSIMSSVLLFLLWFRLKPQPEDRERREDEVHLETTCCLRLKNFFYGKCCNEGCWLRLKNFFYGKCCNEGIPQGQKKPASFWRSAICGYVLGVVMLIFILIIVTLFAIEFNADQNVAVYFYHGSKIGILSLMSLVCLFGLQYLKEHELLPQTPHTIVDTALIMIGVSGCYLLGGLDFTATANDYQSCNGSTTPIVQTHPATSLSCTYLNVSFVDYAFSVIQFTLQAFFIVRALRRCSLVPKCSPDALRPKGKISSAMVVRRCSAFLSIANLGMWAMDTFELRAVKEADVPETHAYTRQSWLILSHVAYPLCIFFRLHSVFCCFEIVINRFQIDLDKKPAYKPVSDEDEEHSGDHDAETVVSS